jgi:hypothetical protein
LGQAASHPAHFEHAVADVAILGQMGGSGMLPVRRHQLVNRPALGKMGVQLLAEFTEATGSRVATLDNGWINVFHEAGSESEQGSTRALPDFEYEPLN